MPNCKNSKNPRVKTPSDTYSEAYAPKSDSFVGMGLKNTIMYDNPPVPHITDHALLADSTF